MVFPLVIAPATLALISGLIRLIAYVSGIVFVSMHLRDAFTKSKEADIEISRDKTIDEILDSTLTETQKTELLKKYLKLDEGAGWEAMILPAVAIIAIAWIAKDMLGKR